MTALGLESRLRLFIALVAVLLVCNNLLPYLGLRDDSCQTMFSGLVWNEGENNHLIVPQAMVSDMWRFYSDVSAELDPPAPEHGRARDLFTWLNRGGEVKNAEAIRSVVRQLCDRGHRVSITYRREPGQPLETHEDACADPRLSSPHRAVPIRLYDSAYPTDM